jgi:HTH-type transcriptional regulator, transcriptional repressor of NAD biosynthesis genes
LVHTKKFFRCDLTIYLCIDSYTKMNKKYKRGLTLGKFIPFHKGHQFLIETALEEVEELLVVVYDIPKYSSISLESRISWIQKLYPQAKLIAARNPPLEEGYEEWIQKLHERFLIDTLGISNVDVFYSSEFYGDHISLSLNAINRKVDDNRTQIPISGTFIRKNPYEHRKFLDPFVYKDLVRKILFLGAPSTGKSTITEFMANEFNTTWMPEYGREYWESHNIERRLTLEQLLEIAVGHIEREDKLILEANRFLFVDTSAITTYLFSLYYHKSALPKLKDLAIQSISRYDMVFLCDTDIPYDDTEDRSGEGNREYFQRETIEFLEASQIHYYKIQGSILNRKNQILEKLHLLEPIFYET